MSEETMNMESRSKAGSGRWVHASKLVAIVVVLVLGVLVMKYLKENGPEADKEVAPRVIPVVRVLQVKATTELLTISTQGRVEPVRRTQAASEVMGRVVMVSPKFKTGGVFSRNDVMLEIDSADYVSAHASAQSSLADAKLSLVQEEARAEQAQRDWRKLGRGEPSELVIRKPQIASVRARISAAEAAVGKAMRDLDRTKLRAPYDCRVQATYTDMGSYIMTGARLADLYSVDAFEVRVPVTLEELGYIDKDGIIGAEVLTEAVIGGKKRQWQGVIVRSEGQVDRETMTMYLVVSIKPNQDAGQYALPPLGLFVQAEIQGKKIEQVTRIPRSALRADHSLFVVNEDNQLEIISVKIVRTLNESVLISDGLKDGCRIIVSPMETPVRGMQLAVEKADGADE